MFNNVKNIIGFDHELIALKICVSNICNAIPYNVAIYFRKQHCISKKNNNELQIKNNE